jgi:hypothetical protein
MLDEEMFIESGVCYMCFRTILVCNRLRALCLTDGRTKATWFCAPACMQFDRRVKWLKRNVRPNCWSPEITELLTNAQPEVKRMR